jgi:hypothetical protein
VTSIPGSSGCSGIGCCEMPIPIGRPSYGVQYKFLEETREVDKVPKAVRIAERGWFRGAVADKLLSESAANTAPRTPVPVVLEWAVASAPVILPGVPQFANASCPTAGEARRSACLSTHRPQQVRQRHRQLPHRLRVPVRPRVRRKPLRCRGRRMPRYRRMQDRRELLRRLHQHAGKFLVRVPARCSW